MPHPEVAFAPGLRERFRTEARAAASLDHPNLVPVFEVGEAGPVCFLVSAYCPGVTLAQWLRQHVGLMPFREAAQLVATLAEAVQHAHERGVVHRDLKPANVLLQIEDFTTKHTKDTKAEKNPVPEGSSSDSSFRVFRVFRGDALLPRITDFGLAKVDQDGAGPTRSGAVVGTPAYMAPEQARGKSKDIGPPADVYALGAILYECLTGRPPFVGESAVETLVQVQNAEPVPPARLRPRLPRDLNVICLMCLHKEPPRRYRSAADLAADLRRFLDGAPIHARPVGWLERLWRWSRRNPAVATLTVVVASLLLLLTVAAVLTARHQAELVVRATEARDEEAKQRQRAETLLVREYIASGSRLAEAGDLSGALPWFAEALRREQDRPGRAEQHAFRLALVMRQQPELVYAWFHDGAVRHAAFSPDGARVATASDDRTVRVWDAVTGQPVIPVLKLNGAATHTAFSPDGKRLLTVSQTWEYAGLSSEVQLWDAATGRKLSWVARCAGNHPTAFFSRDGRRVVTTPEPGKGLPAARVFDTSTGRPVTPLLEHPPQIRHAAFSADGSQVVTGGLDGSAHIWDVATGKHRARLMHGRHVWCVAFHPEGRRLVTAGTDFKARVWDVAGARGIAVLEHSGNVAQAEYSPDGRFLLTASHDRSVRVWETDAYRLVWRHQLDGRAMNAGFSPDGRSVVAAGDDGTAQTWDVATGATGLTTPRHAGTIHHAALSPDGSRLLTASADGTARLYRRPAFRVAALPQEGFGRWAAFSRDGRRLVTCASKTASVWDVGTGGRVVGPLAHEGTVYQSAFSPDGRQLATAGADGAARLWDAATGRLLHALRHDQPVTTVAFSPDGRTLLSAGGAERSEAMPITALWEVATGRRLHTLRHANGAVFSPDGRHVLTGCGDGTARLWDATDGKEIRSMRHSGSVNADAFSPDGKHILCHTPEAAFVWSAADGTLVTAEPRHSVVLRHAAFSPDGRRLVTASDDGTARVWDVASGAPVGQPLQHTGRVFHAAFSPDGRRVATASEDRNFRLWDADTGEPLTAPEAGHAGWAYFAAFSPDGQLLATTGESPAAALWDVCADHRPHADLVSLAEVMSARRLSEQGALPLETDSFRAEWLRLWQKYPAALPSAPEFAANRQARQHQSQARHHAWRGQWEPASAELSRALELVPGDPSLWLERAWAAYSLQRWDEGDADLARAAARAAEYPETHRMVALGFATRNRWREAATFLERLFERGEDDVEVRGWLGRAYLSIGQPAKAAAQLTRALEWEPADGLLWGWRGSAHEACGDLVQAANDYRLAVEKNSPDAWDWFQHACNLHEKGERAAYVQLYRRMVATFGRAQEPIGPFYTARTGLLDPEPPAAPSELLRLAESSCQQILDVRMSSFVLALAHYRSGQFERASATARKALTRSAAQQRQLPQVSLILAMASHRLGRADEARRWLEQARADIDVEDRVSVGAGVMPRYATSGLQRERRLLLREAESVLKER